ncbi:MAG TPA: helix-turn-helix transcriptional regulator [Mycobacteriales bacterium]|jgi:transcriptional regulator with XRE-family HTH domain|nr:helix-turn-helix transcriptional regulator [Mycobacteriales bacterium]
MEIGDLLRDRREKAMLTQTELAERAGVSQSTLSAVERGTRRPSATVVGRVLAAIGQQLRWETEPIEQPAAVLDAEIEATRSIPLEQRLLGHHFDATGLLRLLEPARPVVEGAVGAVLHGVPIAVRRLDIVVERSRLDVLAEVIRRRYAERWNEVWLRFDMTYPDPRTPGPMRWWTLDGEFRVRLVDALPEATSVLVTGMTVAVRTLHGIEADDLHVARALARLRDGR